MRGWRGLARRWGRLAGRGGSSRGPRFVYVSYHKCATQYAERVLRAVCKRRGLRAATFDARHPVVPRDALERTDFLLLLDHASEQVDLDGLDALGVRAIRDPRDILVSMYFSHRSSHAVNHAEIARDRAALADLDVEEGLVWLLDESRFFRRIARELEAWDVAGRGYFETRFERFTSEPAEEFGRMLDFLGLQVGERELARILERNRFDALRRAWARRHPEAKENHYRKGVAGDWRAHLTGRARDRFRERHGDLLVRLGYESDLDW